MTVIAAAFPFPLAAQSVQGTVADSLRLVPVGGVALELLSTEKIVAQAVSDESGHFALAAPAPGSYRVRARRIEYGPVTSVPITVSSGRNVFVAIYLVPLAVKLPPIAISGTSEQFLRMVGFYDRTQSDPGFFMPPDAVAKVAPKARQTADIFDGIPGVALSVGGGSMGVRIPVFTGRSAMGCFEPRFFLDGQLMNPGAINFDVNSILPADVLAIELYRHAAEVPLKFGGNDAACGAIVIWTKH
jgi:hypothetical protein